MWLEFLQLVLALLAGWLCLVLIRLTTAAHPLLAAQRHRRPSVGTYGEPRSQPSPRLLSEAAHTGSVGNDEARGAYDVTAG
jgi:hypothetical protein